MDNQAEENILYHRYSVHTVVNLFPTDVPALSPAVLAFLASYCQDIVALANKPVVATPKVPDDLPLKSYFISSSHNTYLLAWQLFGRSSAAAYTHVLLAPGPARCIEIDVWWDGRRGKRMPIVTHGWTLSKSVPFVDVCKAIGVAVKHIREREDGDDWPVFVSLECHVPLAYQDEIVRIMVECWGDMLVQGEVKGMCEKTVTPRQLRGRIVLMVEYYPDDVIGRFNPDISSETEFDGEPWVILQEEDDRYIYAKVNPDTRLVYPKIADSLAKLGFYARCMEPPKVWWQKVFQSPPHPPNVVLNINESHLPDIPHILPALQLHASHYLRRVYPNGFRVTSSNLDPLAQWRTGTQMACLNWQTWDEGMWLNEAMFTGTGGWIVRPDTEDAGRCTFTVRVVGLSALPRPEGDQGNFVGYCRAELFHRDGKHIWESNLAHSQRDAVAVPEARVSDVDVVHLTWDETFEWSFDADALAFLQLRVVRRHVAWRDEVVAAFCVRLDQLTSGWCLVRLLDKRGKYTGATLLCQFTLEDTKVDDWSSCISDVD